MSQSKRIRLTIKPAGGPDQNLNAGDFVNQLSSLYRAIKASATGQERFDLLVVGLSLDSPATVELEPVGEAGVAIVENFVSRVDEYFHTGDAPKEFGRDVFTALSDFSNPIGKSISRSLLVFDGKEICFDAKTHNTIEKTFGPDEVTSGSVDGMLEMVNVHKDKNTFRLYPVVGPNNIACKFEKKDLENKISPALGKYVQVTGDLKYKWRDKFPFEVFVKEIEVLPNIEDQPKFADILGMAPDATGGVSSDKFVGKLRSEWA
ncbi:MAG: hypothetical protein IH995_03320 [Proteobacteria bacterium]|nr:hypothetical protein [Pseudomonadota bacterium]